MASFVSSATSTVTGYISSGWASVLSLKASQNVVISSIAKAVLNKFALALGLAVTGAFYASKNLSLASIKAEWNKDGVKSLLSLFAKAIVPVAFLGGAVFVAVAL